MITRADNVAQKTQGKLEVSEHGLVCPLAVPPGWCREIMGNGAARSHEETMGDAGRLSQNPRQ